jgi:uncharacterized membrane protein YccC
VREIVALRPEIESVALESSSGSVTSAAARSAAVELVVELQATQSLIADPVRFNAATRDEISAAAGASDWKIREFLRRDKNVRQDLLDLQSFKWPSRLRRTPLYRSYRIAAESGLRAALWFAIAAVFFVSAGWPAASVSLYLVAAVAALGATTPNPRGFTAIALVGAPIAAVLAGIIEFIVLDSADGFHVLALALAPVTIGAALLTTSQNPLWSGLGRINLIAVPTILAPSNPQAYNPQTFLFTSLFVVAAVAVLLAAQTLVPPVSNEKQRARLLAEARDELEEANHEISEAPEEEAFRDASRIAQFLSAGGEHDDRALAEMLACFDQSAMLRVCDERLAHLAEGPLAPLAHEAREAIVEPDRATLRAVASALREKASSNNAIELDVASCLDAIDGRNGVHSSQEKN